MESSQNLPARKRTWLVVVMLLFSYFSFAQVRINELLPINIGIVYDEFNQCSPYVELKNWSTSTADLNFYSLTTNLSDPTKFQLTGKSLQANEKQIIFLDNEDRLSPEIHTNFKFSLNETLYLTKYENFQTIIIDSVFIPVYQYNVSLGKNAENGPLLFQNPSPRQENPIGDNSLSPQPIINLANGTASLAQAFSFTSFANYSNRFTQNGETPLFSLNSQNNGTLIDLTSLGNRFSLIPTNPGLTYPLGDYSQSRANSRGWLPPVGNVPRVNTINSIQFSANGLPSLPLVRTLFTNPPNFNLPIVSLFFDSTDFFNSEKGIYVHGNTTDFNFDWTDDRGKKVVTVQLFDENGQFQNQFQCVTKLKGNGSRQAPQKNIAFGYKNFLQNDFSYKDFILNYSQLRGSGHSPNCLGRDVLGNTFIRGLSISLVQPKTVVNYVNGEFWGLADLRGNLNENYLTSYYQLPKQELAIVDHLFDIHDKNRTDPNEFDDLTLFMDQNSLAINENYRYVEDRLDLNTYTDVLCSQIFLGNADFPRTNINWFNLENESTKSKFKTLIFDLDGIFGGSCDTVYRTFDALNYYTQTSSNSWIRASRPIRALYQSPEYVLRICNRMADLMNSTFRSNNLVPITQDYFASIANAQLPHVNRWRYLSSVETIEERENEVPSLIEWDEAESTVLNFMSNRQRFVYRHFMESFLLADTSRLTLDVNNYAQGNIQINSILISDSLKGVSPIVYPWNGLYFQNLPIQLSAFAKAGFGFVNWSTGATNSDITTSLASNTSISANFQADPSYQNPWMNEVQVFNRNDYADEFAQFPAWVEFFNPNNYGISLEGFFLSNTLSNPTLFQFSSNESYLIRPNAYSTFFLSGVSNRGKEHLPFVLLPGQNLYLFASDGTTLLQTLNIPLNLAENESYGSSPNGTNTFKLFTETTPKANNNESSLEEKKDVNLLAFPNPSKTKFNLTKTLSGKITDINGLCLIEFEKANMIDLSPFANGIYFLSSTIGEQIKLVKQ